MRTLLLFALVLSLSLNVWIGMAVVRLENYRYANQIGLCVDNIMSVGSIQREKCLEASQTRTHWVWHLFYALNP